MHIKTNQNIILASTSSVRKLLLTENNIEFTAISPTFDEESMKDEIAHLPPLDQAKILATEKALSISKQYPDSYVLGADQICYLETTKTILNKPITAEKALLQLMQMNNASHSQNCACVIAKNSQPIWKHAAKASLTMRNLSEQELKKYIEIDSPLHACGSYKFESYGKHLFSKVEGSYDVIKGLPIIPLLNYLHNNKIISIL